VPIGHTERLRRVSDRPTLRDRGQQFEQRVPERSAALCTRLEGIPQVQTQLGLRRQISIGLAGCYGASWSGAGLHHITVALFLYKSTVTEATRVRGAPKCASSEPVLTPVRLLGPIVVQ